MANEIDDLFLALTNEINKLKEEIAEMKKAERTGEETGFSIANATPSKTIDVSVLTHSDAITVANWLASVLIANNNGDLPST